MDNRSTVAQTKDIIDNFKPVVTIFSTKLVAILIIKMVLPLFKIISDDTSGFNTQLRNRKLMIFILVPARI